MAGQDTYAKFTGDSGEQVRIRRSVAPGDPKVWLVADRGGDNNGALHLTPEQCPEVIKALEAFIADAEKLRLDAKRAQQVDIRRDYQPTGDAVGEQIQTCKVGGPSGELPPGADLPMREAVAEAYRRITGVGPEFVFSGWGGSLTEPERAVVEDRLPDPSPT